METSRRYNVYFLLLRVILLLVHGQNTANRVYNMTITSTLGIAEENLLIKTMHELLTMLLDTRELDDPVNLVRLFKPNSTGNSLETGPSFELPTTYSIPRFVLKATSKEYLFLLTQRVNSNKTVCQKLIENADTTCPHTAFLINTLTSLQSFLNETHNFEYNLEDYLIETKLDKTNFFLNTTGFLTTFLMTLLWKDIAFMRSYEISVMLYSSKIPNLTLKKIASQIDSNMHK